MQKILCLSKSKPFPYLITRISRLGFRGACVISILFLQSCADVALSGAQLAYNRHSISKTVSDQYITMKVHQALKIDSKEFQDANIAIATFNGEVLLAGQVPVAEQKGKAEAITKTIPGVKKIYNLVSIASPSSSLTRISDSLITTKIKGKLLVANDIDPATIKVVTENGTVYLMGTVFPKQAETAVNLARNTQGVLSVVKIFSYLSISNQA